MTDLIKRLREADTYNKKYYAVDPLHQEAADRIEELVKERDYTEGTNDTLIALNQSLEAKLTKAVEERDEYKAAAEICGKAARTMLAQLEGKE